jgi:hypothetical protein
MPMVILLLGAFSPNTEDGTIAGNAHTAPAATPFRRKARLNNLYFFSVIFALK